MIINISQSILTILGHITVAIIDKVQRTGIYHNVVMGLTHVQTHPEQYEESVAESGRHSINTVSADTATTTVSDWALCSRVGDNGVLVMTGGISVNYDW